MIIYYLTIFIYLSFVLDFLVWPIPSEASTAELIKKGNEISLMKKVWYLGASIVCLVIFVIPLVMTIEILFNSSNLNVELRTAIGLVISITGRILTLYAVLLLRKERINGLIRFSIFKYSRNPIALGIYLTLFGLVIVFASWYLWLGLTLFVVNIHSKVKMEELELMKKYPEYRDYMRKTPRYF